MEHQHWMFWFVPLLIFLVLRRGRWDGWGPRGPRGRRDGGREDEATTALRHELEQQRDYTLTLEDRVAQLEERIDFTERLLAARHESATSE